MICKQWTIVTLLNANSTFRLKQKYFLPQDKTLHQVLFKELNSYIILAGGDGEKHLCNLKRKHKELIDNHSMREKKKKKKKKADTNTQY